MKAELNVTRTDGWRQGTAYDRQTGTVRWDRTLSPTYVELGVRARIAGRVDVEAAAYRMTKTDDVLSFTRDDGSTETVNAGETLHRGIELAAGAPFGALRVDIAWSWMRHEYTDWQPRADIDSSGNEMEDAPEEIGNVNVRYAPAVFDGGAVGIEWQRIGQYWMDAANTHRYPGHDLFNLRASYPFDRVTLFEEYAPGLPRSLYLGVEVR